MHSNTLVNLGIQRFDKLIEQKRFYIDKTGFIKEWWETGSTVSLITRPRRFGKTLNMSMLECFFSNKYAGRGDLFEGLSIWSDASLEETEPERFYHGFVLGMVVNLADTYKIRSNRESGYGRYDVMLEPIDRSGKTFIFEFRVLSPYEDEKTLKDTLANAHAQIDEKQYETELISEGFVPEQIRKYGFAFQGKNCLIG